MEKRKKLAVTISTFGVVLILLGVTYSFFNYTRTGLSNTITVGRISFNSNQTNTITLLDVFPIDKNDVNTSNQVGTSTISITGDTDYSGGIEYLLTVSNLTNTIGNKEIPIDVTVSATGIGDSDTDYFENRGGNSSIYKVMNNGTINNNGRLLVGYITEGTTGVNGTVTIKAYLDKNKIAITDTYDGTESDNNGTTTNWVDGRFVLTTTEWNNLQENGVSFQVKVEANEGVWVNDTLDNIIRTKNLNTTTNQPIMDNVRSEFVSASTGIDFGAVSSDTNGKGVYMRAGTENDSYPIVYYRGAVEDNNVLFNNKCWKAVRTTDTGGVKLIYNGENKGTAETPNCANTETDTFINLSGTNMFKFNTGYNSPAYVGYMYGDVYPYSSSDWTSGARFGSSFTWDGTNYKLVDDSVTEPNATHHYSCNVTTENGTCTSIGYVFWDDGNSKYSITLTGGDGVEEALTKMQTNTNNSDAKTQIDSWYASNMNTATSKLEDTIWCNDRSVGKANGWSATGSWGTNYNDYSILYGAFERSNYASSTSTVKNQPSLTCANRNDAFTVSNGNGNGKLTYPVALLTEDEMVLAGGLAGGRSQFYLNNGNTYYWSLSPYVFDYSARMFRVSNSLINGSNWYNSYGLRPSVSLKPGMPVVKGDGTVNNPYVISSD